MEGDYQQFKYFSAEEGRLEHLQLASEELLKEIGVDIKKFLQKDKEQSQLSDLSQDKGNVKTNSQNYNPNIAPSSYQFSLPSLSALQNPGMMKTSDASTTQVLDMKFRQMKFNRVIPTDDQMEEFRENHKRRMQIIEERYLRSEEDKVEDEVQKSTIANQEPVQSLQEMEVEEQEEEKESMFQLTSRKRELIKEEEEDLEIQDLSDEENVQIATSSISSSTKLTMVKKTHQDKEDEQQLIKLLVSQMQIEEKEISQPNDGNTGNQDDFGDIDSMLESAECQKVYESSEILGSKLPIRIQSNDDPVEIDEATKVQYSQYLSWQSNANTIQQEDDSRVQTFDAFDLQTFDDPHILKESQASEEEGLFKYNEHGIYSDHSEDEEAVVLNDIKHN